MYFVYPGATGDRKLSGKDKLGDFFEGIAQGADASFEDMARSFLLRLAEMEARAIASDLVGALTGRGDGATSITGRLLGGAADLVTEDKKAGDDAKRAESSAERISSQLFGAIENGADRLLEAGSSAGNFIASAAGSIGTA